jgi:tRNA-dihydrouridine synthase
MALAPMANVTDAAFREMIAKNGKPDVFWTEFVSADGLLSSGREKLLVDFWYSENERPIVAQIFGATPEHYFKAAQLIKELKFDGIDINMGCPERSIQKQGSCAALIGNPKLAQEIIQATKEGAGELPVSVKTRIGLSKITLDEWLPVLLATDLAAITLHLRTRKEMSKVPAHWEIMPEAVAMVKQIPESRRPLLLGNGDVMTLEDADLKCQETGCDGVMIGRGIFGNPWMFNRDTPIENIPIPKRLAAMIEHTKLFEQKFHDIKDFDVMKKPSASRRTSDIFRRLVCRSSGIYIADIWNRNRKCRA